MILDQQIELHFGDTYRNVVSQTVRFCKTVINKPWWGANRTVLLTNEGGMVGMRRHALLRIIERGDVTLGLKDYGNYLREEYGSDKILYSLEDIQLSSTIEIQSSGALGSAPTEPPVEARSFDDLQSQYDLFEKIHLSPSEREFFTTYSSVRDIREASALCGLSYEDGKRLYDRVKARAKYQLQP